MRTPPPELQAWIDAEVHASESRGHLKFYLGSMPFRRNVPTQGETDREDQLTYYCDRMRLLLSIVHSPSRDRRFFFVVRGDRLDSLDYRPKVSKLVFGELDTEDSEGFKGVKKLPGRALDFVPLELLERAIASKLPMPGTEYGVCVDSECGHLSCAETRFIAGAKCTQCPDAIGYGVEYTEYRFQRSEIVDGEYPRTATGEKLPLRYAHMKCVYDDTEEILAAPHPFNGKPSTSYVAPEDRPAKEVAA